MKTHLLISLFCLISANDEAKASEDAPKSSLPQADWSAIQADRNQEIQKYLESASGGYEWFAHAMHGEAAGTPFLFLRLLPELAPDIWGPPQERFAQFGFLDDPKDSDRPLPLGFGWVLDPVKGDPPPASGYHSATLTCAACHVGQARVGPNQRPLLIGAPNTRIDVRKFRRAIELSAERLLAPEPVLKETVARFIELVKSKPEGYFFGGRYGIDAQAEAKERMKLQDPEFAARELGAFGRRVQAGRAAVIKQLATSYSKPNAPPLDGGSPGQSDGSGDLIPKLLLGRELSAQGSGDIRKFLDPATLYPELPYRNATTTDNLSVWRQADRPFGQLDGSIKTPIIRNVAAQTAVVGGPLKINLKNADIAARFTAHLPPPPYPFGVDLMRARRGETLYQQNCATCHRIGDGTVYGSDAIDTDMNRARVLGPEGKALLLTNFRAAFLLNDPDYEVEAADGSKYKPAQLTDDEIINDRTRSYAQGYVAGPLDGVWARAPYLHNGSVPTLRHLLAPRNPESRRPQAFLRGSIRYDTLNVGFAWNPDEAARSADHAPPTAIFDTRWDGASNQGHDRDITVKGRLHRLDWSGPEHRSELEDLLEYLKTL